MDSPPVLMRGHSLMGDPEPQGDDQEDQLCTEIKIFNGILSYPDLE